MSVFAKKMMDEGKLKMKISNISGNEINEFAQDLCDEANEFFRFNGEYAHNARFKKELSNIVFMVDYYTDEELSQI